MSQIPMAQAGSPPAASGRRWLASAAGPPSAAPDTREGSSILMAFDVSKVRAAYPALADGYAYLDGAAGTLP